MSVTSAPRVTRMSAGSLFLNDHFHLNDVDIKMSILVATYNSKTELLYVITQQFKKQTLIFLFNTLAHGTLVHSTD